MELSNNDVIFLQQLKACAEKNIQNEEKSTLQVSKAHLSDKLLILFDVQDNNNTGAWFFNVYIEFVPMFKEVPTKDWQQ